MVARVTPVLAEDYSTFRKFIEKENLNLGHFAFIKDENAIRGYRGLVLAIGQWWRNQNYDSDFYNIVRGYSNAGLVSVIKGIAIVNDPPTFAQI